MADPETVRNAFERKARAIELRPSVGQYTTTTRIRLRNGTMSEVEHGDWKLTADLGHLVRRQ